MSEVEKIIQAFGGLSATAKALGHKHVTTVQGWKRRGHIPHWRESEIKAAALRLDITIPADEAKP